MNYWKLFIVIACVVALGGGVSYYFKKHDHKEGDKQVTDALGINAERILASRISLKPSKSPEQHSYSRRDPEKIKIKAKITSQRVADTLQN